MPTNLYGPGDNYHPENSHVLPALIGRFHHAKVENLPGVTIWGTGRVRREFLYVEDMASASVHVMNMPPETYSTITSPMQSHINVGSGSDVTIAQLAQLVQEVVGYKGSINYDASKPDGAPRKWMDSQKLQALGWKPANSLGQGIRAAYDDFLNNPSLRKK
jgi:GDP-L-fucose synthase